MERRSFVGMMIGSAFAPEKSPANKLVLEIKASFDAYDQEIKKATKLNDKLVTTDGKPPAEIRPYFRRCATHLRKASDLFDQLADL